MKRRSKATTIYLAEVPKPLDVETEVVHAIDARQKLQAAIDSENRKRDAAEIEFARIVVKEISGWQVVNVDVVLQSDVGAKSAAERFKQRIEALQSVLARVNKRIEQLKYDCPEAVNAALTKRIEALKKTVSENAEARKDLEEQISLLKAEMILKSSKAAVNKAS